MSVVTRGELARGFSNRTVWESFCAGFTVYPLDDEVVWNAPR